MIKRIKAIKATIDSAYPMARSLQIAVHALKDIDDPRAKRALYDIYHTMRDIKVPDDYIPGTDYFGNG